MNRLRKIITTSLLSLVFIVSNPNMLTAKRSTDAGYRISCGVPVIAGGLGATVIKSQNHYSSLVVSVNFGEVSPINRNRFIRVILPVTVRGRPPYDVTATATIAGEESVLNLTDIGFAVQNLRKAGAKANGN